MTASKNDIYHGIASIVMEIPQNSIYVSVFQSYSTGNSSKEINWKISRNSQREGRGNVGHLQESSLDYFNYFWNKFIHQ